MESSVKKRPHRDNNFYLDPSLRCGVDQNKQLDTLETSFRAKIEVNTKKKIRMEELNNNPFIKDFLTVLNEDQEKVSQFERYTILYKLLALARVPSKEKDVVQVLEVLVEL
eukprot:CAMPEP_0170553410 /NCGR_PEP_ID=MMETSP0211-20121228/11221_1 /TAXON_ID=311385 /ORGANISM="Pseudokeronopsis sp., Strain OXSARD2" /LENGTH=110 /DNA_ID=CAMNT_0010861707 /DNA_START=270 /DNA_END=602 /DNA_ORIENTATION=+